MTFLKRAGAFALGTTLAVAGQTVAEAQNKEIRGSALSVSDAALTVKAGEETLSFVIDRSTLVEAKGASTRTRQAEAAGKSPAIKITDYVKPGEAVLVSYRPVDGKNLAIWVRPISAVGRTGAGESAKNVQAKVKSISGNSLILDQDGRDLRFIVDRETDVVAAGGTRATRRAGGALPITDFVHAGDIVRVEYTETGGSMKALQVQVRSRATIPVK